MESKDELKKKQWENRVDIAEDKAKLAGNEAKEKMNDWTDDVKQSTKHASNVAKEKATEAKNWLEENAQKAKHRLDETFNK